MIAMACALLLLLALLLGLPVLAVRRIEPTTTKEDTDAGSAGHHVAFGNQSELRSLQQGAEICFTGFVMDKYCIDRGILLDSSLTETLEEPNRHSIHCLVDVDRCVASGYQMLLDDPDDDGIHCRVLELDSKGTDLTVKLARSTGEQGYCETCSGPEGAQSRGKKSPSRIEKEVLAVSPYEV